MHWDVLPPEGPAGLGEAETRSWLALLRADDLSAHPFEVDVTWLEAGSVSVRPVGGLDPDTDYLLTVPDCGGLQPHARCPAPLRLSTRSAPRVVSLWRSSDTLIVVFSEPMDSESLALGHEAVDLVFEEAGVTYTVASDLNLADFAWSAEGAVFTVAPISDLPIHLVLGPDVRGATGAALDVDGDGHSDPDQSWSHFMYPTLLPICWTRADYPAPCVTAHDAESSLVDYIAPLEVALDLP